MKQVNLISVLKTIRMLTMGKVYFSHILLDNQGMYLLKTLQHLFTDQIRNGYMKLLPGYIASVIVTTKCERRRKISHQLSKSGVKFMKSYVAIVRVNAEGKVFASEGSWKEREGSSSAENCF